MDNSDIKIIYFDLPGRAEAIRLVLVMVGKVFEDVRVNGEKWREIKPTTPFGTCPVLVLDGKMYGQSKAIAAYLAKVYGIYGNTTIEMLQIDQIMYLVEDLIQAYADLFFFEKDATKKIEGSKQLKEEICPRYLGYFEQMLADNGSGYLVGDSMTVADIYVFDVCTGFLKPIAEGCVDRFALVKRLVETVGSNDRINAYMSKRK